MTVGGFFARRTWRVTATLVLLCALLGAVWGIRASRNDGPGTPLRVCGEGCIVQWLAWSPDGQLLAIAANEELTIWALPERRVVFRQALSPAVLAVAWSPDGRFLAAANVRSERMPIVVLDTATWSEVRQLNSEGVRTIAWSPDGRTLAAGGDGRSVRLWAMPDGKLLYMLSFSSLVYRIAFSPDGQTLASRSDRLSLWRVSDGTLLRELGRADYYGGIAFSPSGDEFAATIGPEVRRWRFSDLVALPSLTGYSDMLVGLAYSPDGRTIAGGGGLAAEGIGIRDSSVRLWRVADGVLVQMWPGTDKKMIVALAFSPDGRTVVTGGYEPFVRFWALDTADEVTR